MERKTTNVIFAGVGGQGVILASKILLDVAMHSGYDVKESEVHGMAQRGGSVDCNVRFGEKVYSPLIAHGSCDFLVGFELLEGIRKLEFLKPDGHLLVNQLRILPTSVETGSAQYPEQEILQWFANHPQNSKLIDSQKILLELGSGKVLNVLMLGVLANYLEFSESDWLDAIKKNVKPKFLELNQRAFLSGRKF